MVYSLERKDGIEMLKNENLRVEVKTIIANSGIRLTDIARAMGVTPQTIVSTYKKKMLDGEENWIKALDVAGYDVEVKIKPKPKK